MTAAEVTTTSAGELALAPEVRTQVDEATHAAAQLVARAERLTITNDTEAEFATEFLARVARVRKDTQAQRKAAVGPLNAKVKAINEAFNGQPMRLLDEGDRIVRAALLPYEEEKKRKAAEEQARLEAERRAEQERLEAQRRAAEEAAAEARRQAEEAERRRQAEIAAAQDETRKRIAAMDDDELQDELTSHRHDDSDYAAALVEEHHHRETQRAAAQAASEAADAARVAELQVCTAPVPVALAPAALRATSGSAHTTKRWVAEVVDEQAVVQAWLDGRVPEDFVKVDEVAVGKYIRSAKSEHAEHPGITYRQDTSLAVRTAR